MYDNYMRDVKLIKAYEGKVCKFGAQYGETHIRAFKQYNTAKYNLATDGLDNGTTN